MNANNGLSMVLNDQQGHVWTGSAATINALAIKAPLTGSLTIYGLTQSSGQPQSWVLTPGTPAGVYAAPGTGQTGGNLLAYALSSADDSAKACIAYSPN